MVRFTKIIVGAAALALMLAGCSASSAGTLKVCSDTPYPPFEFEDPSAPSGFSGFDIDIITAIAERLDLKIEVHMTDFNALQSGAALAAGKCDIGASAITITEERKANIDYSDPYYDSLQSLLVHSSSPAKSLADMSGLRIGVQTGTTGEIYATEHAPKDATLVDFPTDGELWLALQAKQVDALLQDYPVNNQHVKDDSSYVIIDKFETDEQYGFAFAKGKNTDLRKSINEQLQAIRDDGTYETIYNKYFG